KCVDNSFYVKLCRNAARKPFPLSVFRWLASVPFIAISKITEVFAPANIKFQVLWAERAPCISSVRRHGSPRFEMEPNRILPDRQ
ncbi:hypothetical protein, partial [Paraburkholderia sediminicola]